MISLWTPWGQVPETIPAAHSHELGGSSECSSVVLPLLHERRETGLVAHSDGHRVGERGRSCPTQDGSDPTRNGA